MERAKTAVGIIFLSMGAAIAYGILHDQITVRVCLEYFTIGHYPIFGDQPATVLAILWGTVATWWMGLILGFILALAATLGSQPIRTVHSFVRPVLKLLIAMAICAGIAGMTGYLLASNGSIGFDANSEWGERVPKEKQALFLANAFAHNASYLVGFFGGLGLAASTWISRRKAPRQPNETQIST